MMPEMSDYKMGQLQLLYPEEAKSSIHKIAGGGDGRGGGGDDDVYEEEEEERESDLWRGLIGHKIVRVCSMLMRAATYVLFAVQFACRDFNWKLRWSVYVGKSEDLSGMHNFQHSLINLSALIFPRVYKQVVMEVGACVPLAQFLLRLYSISHHVGFVDQSM
jgi:hypothetical protein